MVLTETRKKVFLRRVDMEAYLTAAAMHAYRQLVAINQKSGEPEMQEWLVSATAEQLLTELLANVPCSQTIH